MNFGTPSKHIERRYLPDADTDVLIRDGVVESHNIVGHPRFARLAAWQCATRRYTKRDAQLSHNRFLLASAQDADDPSWSDAYREDVAAVRLGYAADAERRAACDAAVARLRAELAEAAMGRAA